MALGKSSCLGVPTFTLAVAKDMLSPNEPIPKPEYDERIPGSIRYSLASSRLYLESVDGNTRSSCVTLAQTWEHQRGKALLYAVDPETGGIKNSAIGIRLLTEELFVEDGITLQVRYCLLGRAERQ